MSSNLKYIGIDGCRDGWFCVSLGENGDWSCRVISDAQSLGEYVRAVFMCSIFVSMKFPKVVNANNSCFKFAHSRNLLL